MLRNLEPPPAPRPSPRSRRRPLLNDIGEALRLSRALQAATGENSPSPYIGDDPTYVVVQTSSQFPWYYHTSGVSPLSATHMRPKPFRGVPYTKSGSSSGSKSGSSNISLGSPIVLEPITNSQYLGTPSHMDMNMAYQMPPPPKVPQLPYSYTSRYSSTSIHSYSKSTPPLVAPQPRYPTNASPILRKDSGKSDTVFDPNTIVPRTAKVKLHNVKPAKPVEDEYSTVPVDTLSYHNPTWRNPYSPL